MATTQSSNVRNLAIVGHSGSGKTSVFHALAAACAAEITDSLGFASGEWAGLRINLLDALAPDDLAGLSTSDVAIFVVSASGGLDVAAQKLWQLCDEHDLTRIVLLSHLEDPAADFTETAALCQRVFSDSVLPIMLPVFAGDPDSPGAPSAAFNLMTQTIHDHSDGTLITITPDEEHLELAINDQDALVEAILAESDDETLIATYVADGALPTAQLQRAMYDATGSCALFPLLPVSATPSVGIAELLELINELAPNSSVEPLVVDAEGDPVSLADTELCALVVRVHEGGSLLRTYAGTLVTDEGAVIAAGDFGMTAAGYVAGTTISGVGLSIRPWRLV